MEGFNLYNISEYLLHQLIYIVSGVKVKYSDNLEKIILVPLENNEQYVEWAKEAIKNEFSLKVEVNEKILDKLTIPKRSYFIVKKLLNDLESFKEDTTTGIIFITKKNILMRDRIMLRLFHSIFPIMGIAYLIPGVCAVTTVQDRIPKKAFNYTVSHEIGHLLGKHGYPVSK